jgi:hypothetical protein
MQPVSKTIPELTQAIQQHKHITITPGGGWYHKSLLSIIVDLFRRIFGYDESFENAKNLATYLASPQKVSSDAIKGLRQKDDWKFHEMNTLVTAVKESLRPSIEKEEAKILKLINRRKSLSARTQIVALNQKIFALKNWPYRDVTARLDRGVFSQEFLGKNQPEIDQTQPLRRDTEWLKWQLAQWEPYQFPRTHYDPHCDWVRARINRSCQYQTFIDAARENQALLELFLRAVFGNRSNVDVFIQTPNVQEGLEKALLHKRLQRTDNDGLRLGQLANSTEKPIKIVTLFINGTHQSITNLSDTCQIDTAVTVSEIIGECKNQNKSFISLEYLWDRGLARFDGRLFDFDIQQNEWWKKLPVIFQPLTIEQIQLMYGVTIKSLGTDDAYGLFIARSSRTTPDNSPKGAHSWCNIIYPSDKPGQFTLIAPGKYATWFPITVVEYFLHTFGSFKANITLCDLNEFISSREQISVSVGSMTKQQFLTGMDFLKTKLQESREGNLVFQSQGDDCAHFIQEFADVVFSPNKINLYKMRFEDLTVPAPLSLITKVKPYFPSEKSWQQFRRGFCYLCGAARSLQLSNGKVVRLSDFENYRSGHIDFPGGLWNHREEIAKTLRVS